MEEPIRHLLHVLNFAKYAMLQSWRQWPHVTFTISDSYNTFPMTIPVNSQVSHRTLFHALKRHTALFLACGLLGAVVAVGIAFMIPKQWPATLLFQIGQVGGAGNLLADPNNVIQRIKFPGFVSQVLQSQNLPTDESISDRSDLIKKSLNATMAKGGEPRRNDGERPLSRRS
ncbi:Wzz/FepE/Etk N-terminal domain-containing protein [Collimonas antrihumi]|uniref:Wzz/FepE/Etk N-terminal domain-containing protein n=1 Tax=Collimonas antrihumi TaxID=1940615 RepID=UPI001B8C14ED